ncbi:CLUMA_CG014391, isoform A [Clunio marinus]|uniref:Probable RNA polymerase II nuclear localization protein SLC7A6OS n=1 Tax=Clunio marinus TaxID=568069 RepID=A0A1J1IM33_9DIPT|nr:CLUMA_CG014391, isoform A [Clunio marinus]
MSAIIRMKRHISDNPHEAFVLNCKKRKTDNKENSLLEVETTTVLKFAGTVNQDTNLTEHIAKLSKEDAKDIVKKKREVPNVKTRIDENREKSQQNRFKIVNYTRALNESTEESTDKNLTIVDVEKDVVSNNTQNTSSITSDPGQSTSSFNETAEEPYVYDIYVAVSPTSPLQHPDSLDLNDLSILEYNDYLYSHPRLVNSSSEDENENEDEDSNDEDNWRNDYPDEELSDNGSIGEREMRKAMNNINVGFDLSSDEEDENGFVYSVDSEAFSFEDDLDYCDVNRYGEAYARYKKRVLKDIENGSDSSDTTENSHMEDDSFHSD